MVREPHEEKIITRMRKAVSRETRLASDDRRCQFELSNPGVFKKKSSRRPIPRWVEREPDSALARLISLAEIAGSRHASGRSPDLVSQMHKPHASRPPAAFPIFDQWLIRRRLREHHSGGTARESHPLPYSPRFISGHPKLKKEIERTELRNTNLTRRSKRGQSEPELNEISLTSPIGDMAQSRVITSPELALLEQASQKLAAWRCSPWRYSVLCPVRRGLS